jgi:hypothetical protein
MPVLSDPPHNGFLSARVFYLFLSLLLTVFILIFLSRKRSSHQTMITPLPEKSPFETSSSSDQQSAQQLAKPRISLPVSAQPTSPEMNTSSLIETSFPPAPGFELLPRRRSYTKNMPDGGEVSGEIIVAEGWRRHTRVFGGGVCKACEESERRMGA